MPSQKAVETQVLSGFLTTHWSAIETCAQTSDLAFLARSELCKTYWAPVQIHLLRRGYSRHDAEDLTQGFFASILSRPWFHRADRNRGRFRSFLLTSLRHYVSDQQDRDRALQRGGGFEILSIADLSPSDELAAEEVQTFDAAWSKAVIRAALSRLEADYTERGMASEYGELSLFLSSLGDANAYRTVANRMQTSTEAVKVAVHRIRRRYGGILREEVARTVSTSAEVADELFHLRHTLLLDTAPLSDAGALNT